MSNAAGAVGPRSLWFQRRRRREKGEKERCKDGAQIDQFHQEWEVHEPHGPGPKRGQETGIEKEQEAANDGAGGCAQDEGPKTDNQRHGETG